ncbi:MAG: tRNA lysidine(34) synthetase TilS [Culturomica sp.]|jgi:tRNA(Ile)-lysidine synthase|nr:tRNA lysidine(34) synthetase TilS [Culturomica sp.]
MEKKTKLTDFFHNYDIPLSSYFLLGVSGGPDSMAMLHAFIQLGLQVKVLHCNFRLRGKESDEDEKFVEEYCHEHKVPFIAKKFNTAEYANINKMSIEMAARELRYKWFSEMKNKENADYIAVAHHADDSAETVFINLTRGTGIRGLTGISPITSDFVIRPLLAFSHEEIETYLKENNIPFRIDRTNTSDIYVRNFIRHQIIPAFKKINPSFLNTIRENCKILQETAAIFDYAIEELKKSVLEIKNEEIRIDIDKTLQTPAPSTFLHEILAPYGFNKEQIREILLTAKAISGKKFYGDNYTVVKNRTYWLLYPTPKENLLEVVINQVGTYEYGNYKIHFSTFPAVIGIEIPKKHNSIWIDADKISFPITVRTWQKGDRFMPIGMKGRMKKLSNFFIDLKLSEREKQQVMIFEVQKEIIIWVAPHRISENVKITDTTKNIMEITIIS